MAFKRRTVDTISTENPQSMFRDLTRKTIRGIIDYQSAILTAYQERALNEPNVTIDLPTGGGKSLIGTLIAEWRRRKYRERCAYFCPTVQLAKQTAEYATKKYGLDVALLTGKIKNYHAADKNAYQTGSSIAISTYSSLFNTNPFFSDCDLVIFDDAHASETYVASLWTVEVSQAEDAAAFSALSAIIDPLLSPASRSAFHSSEERLWDRAWVELVPIHKWFKHSEELLSVLDEYADSSEFRYEWEMIKHHFLACQIYLGPRVISIRPVTPPTASFPAFVRPKQRIFMSATLGESGDLQRITGVSDFVTISAPESMLKLGLGRRFFIFPSAAQDDEDPITIEKALISESPKALVLLPSHRLAEEEKAKLSNLAGYSLLGIEDLEDSKEPFVSADKAIAILAGRYDGLDFPDDECRLIIIRGLPGAMELQERFLRNKASAAEFLALRIRNRIVQAVGRCTRNENDKSAVVVLEDDLLRYFQQRETRELLPLELQAEILFGLEQSADEAAIDMVSRLRSFLLGDAEWLEAESDIRSYRGDAKAGKLSYADQLEESAKLEVQWQKQLWDGLYTKAFETSRSICDVLSHPSLRGYRSFWSYLAGTSAFIAEMQGLAPLQSQADAQFRYAASVIPELAPVNSPASSALPGHDEAGRIMLQRAVEGIELQLSKLAISSNKKFDRFEREIRTGLNNAESKQFEGALLNLGSLLGFQTGKVEDDSTPDPWWLIDSEHVIVFEAHSAGISEHLGARKARQAAGHVKWIKKKVVSESAEVLPVMLSDAQPSTEGASIQLSGVSLWKLSDFRAFAVEALAAIREIRRDCPGRGNIVWRSSASDILKARRLDPFSIISRIKSYEWGDGSRESG